MVVATSDNFHVGFYRGFSEHAFVLLTHTFKFNTVIYLKLLATGYLNTSSLTPDPTCFYTHDFLHLSLHTPKNPCLNVKLGGCLLAWNIFILISNEGTLQLDHS